MNHHLQLPGWKGRYSALEAAAHGSPINPLLFLLAHLEPNSSTWLGTSRTIPRKQYSASRVAKGLSKLLDNPNYAAKAAEIGRIVQAENGVGVACDAIEKQVREVAIVL